MISERKLQGRSAVFIRHVLHEDGGTFAAYLESTGWIIQYVEAPALHQNHSQALCLSSDLLVCLGGPISANDERSFPFLAIEVALLQRRIAEDRPTVGICLGGQLLAKAGGGFIKTLKKKEIGWSPLSLAPQGTDSPLAALAGTSVLHWHGETFTLPDDGRHLASTELCDNQAFILGRNCMGLQFHPEVTAAGLERWYIAEAGDLNGPDGVGGVSALRATTAHFGPLLEARAVRFWEMMIASLRFLTVG